jgi:hypothetical protein
MKNDPVTACRKPKREDGAHPVAETQDFQWARSSGLESTALAAPVIKQQVVDSGFILTTMQEVLLGVTEPCSWPAAVVCLMLSLTTLLTHARNMTTITIGPFWNPTSSLSVRQVLRATMNMIITRPACLPSSAHSIASCD